MRPTRHEPRGPPKLELAIVEKKVDRFSRAASQLESVNPHVQLAEERALFAAERSYLAWVQTGLMAFVSGVGAWALLGTIAPGWLARSVGTSLILASVICFIAAVWRDLVPRTPLPSADARRLSPHLLVVTNGFLIFLDTAVLIGLWSRRLT